MAFPGGRFHPFQLRAAKSDVLHRIGRWKELIAMLEQDLAQARALEAPVYQGRCLLKLGIIDAQRGNFAEAGEKTASALGIYEAAGDGPGVFQCRSTLLKIASNLAEYEKAEKMALELLSEARLKHDISGENAMLNNLGLVCLKMGRDKEALEYLNRKLELSKELGDESGRASALGNIGGVYYANQQYQKAATCDRESIEICQRIGDVYAEYFALYNLAKACERMGRNEEALSHYRRDLEMARQLGDEPGEGDILEDLARVNAAITGEGC
jgi:tetratricopeptide (TPR) repeat protein